MMMGLVRVTETRARFTCLIGVKENMLSIRSEENE